MLRRPLALVLLYALTPLAHATYYDAETGLLYNHHRYYDPKAGRYLTPDPIGLRGGLNPYLYANANPLRFVDPTGLLSCTYQISTHTLSCQNNLGQGFMTNQAVSGNGGCKDNPSCSDKKDVGPLPPGYYMINTPGVFDPLHPPVSPNTSLWLQGPSGVSNPGDRNGIYVHLFGLSKGCIALRTQFFNKLKNWSISDNGGDLFVLP